MAYQKDPHLDERPEKFVAQCLKTATTAAIPPITTS